MGQQAWCLKLQANCCFGTIAKIFDALMADKLTDKLICLVIDNQHEFIRRWLIITNLRNYSHYIAESLHENT